VPATVPATVPDRASNRASAPRLGTVTKSDACRITYRFPMARSMLSAAFSEIRAKRDSDISLPLYVIHIQPVDLSMYVLGSKFNVVLLAIVRRSKQYHPKTPTAVEVGHHPRNEKHDPAHRLRSGDPARRSVT